MADAADIASEESQTIHDKNIEAARAAAALIPAGAPGDCDLCGEWSGRLVAGVCCPCRDKRGSL